MALALHKLKMLGKVNHYSLDFLFSISLAWHSEVKALKQFNSHKKRQLDHGLCLQKNCDVQFSTICFHIYLRIFLKLSQRAYSLCFDQFIIVFPRDHIAM